MDKTTQTVDGVTTTVFLPNDKTDGFNAGELIEILQSVNPNTPVDITSNKEINVDPSLGWTNIIEQATITQWNADSVTPTIELFVR